MLLCPCNPCVVKSSPKFSPGENQNEIEAREELKQARTYTCKFTDCKPATKQEVV